MAQQQRHTGVCLIRVQPQPATLVITVIENPDISDRRRETTRSFADVKRRARRGAGVPRAVHPAAGRQRGRQPLRPGRRVNAARRPQQLAHRRVRFDAELGRQQPPVGGELPAGLDPGCPRRGGPRSASAARSRAADRRWRQASRPRPLRRTGPAAAGRRSTPPARAAAAAGCVSRSIRAQSSYQPGNRSMASTPPGRTPRSAAVGHPSISRFAHWPISCASTTTSSRRVSDVLSASISGTQPRLSRHSEDRRLPAARRSSTSGQSVPAAYRRSTRRPCRATNASRRLLPSGIPARRGPAVTNGPSNRCSVTPIVSAP